MKAVDWVKVQAAMRDSGQRLQIALDDHMRRMEALRQALKAAQDARGSDLTGSEGETGSESIRGSERNSAGRNEGDA